MYLIGYYSKSATKVNNATAKEYKWLRENQSYLPTSLENVQMETPTLTLLNTRSLNNNVTDVVSTSLTDMDLLFDWKTIIENFNCATFGKEK